MPDFEFPELRNPFENKKLQPVLIAGVVLVAAYVLITKQSRSSSSAATDTEYQQTYASNTGITTQVSTMMEDYKEQVSDMLEENQAVTDEKLTTQNETILQYMDELNTMFDEKHAAWDDEYDQSMDALQTYLEKMQDNQNDALENMQNQFNSGMDAVKQQMGDLQEDNADAMAALKESNNSAMALLSGIVSGLQEQLTGISNKQDALAAEQERQNALAQERTEASKATTTVKNYYSNPTNNTNKNYSDFNVTNGRDSNYNDDGTAYLTQGLFDMMADMSGNSSTSHADYTNANYKYYYEDSAGNVSSSAVQSMSQSTDASGNTTTHIRFEDGSSKTITH